MECLPKDLKQKSNNKLIKFINRYFFFNYKSNIVVSNSNARLNSKELFLITSTSDFDAGKKNYIETINDYGNIADGAIQIKLGDIYADNFVTETDGLSPPINWTLDTKKPVLQKFEIDNVRARTNSNSPRCIWIKGPTSSDGDAHHDFMSPYITADEVPFELWVYLPSYSQHNIKVAQQATTGDWDNNEVMAFLGFMQGKNIEYNWGGWIDTGFDWTIGWHRVRIYHNFTLDGWYCMYDGTRVPAAGYLPPAWCSSRSAAPVCGRPSVSIRSSWPGRSLRGASAAESRPSASGTSGRGRRCGGNRPHRGRRH